MPPDVIKPAKAAPPKSRADTYELLGTIGITVGIVLIGVSFIPILTGVAIGFAGVYVPLLLLNALCERGETCTREAFSPHKQRSLE